MKLNLVAICGALVVYVCANGGPPVTAAAQAALRDGTEKGAERAAGVGGPASTGIQKDKPTSGPYVETAQGYMVPYKQTIPGAAVTLEMVPIPGGVFTLGSPVGEPGRNEDEGPQVQVTTPPFWLGKYEVTWAAYKPFMRLYGQFKQLEQLRSKVESAKQHSDVKLAESLASAPLLMRHLKRTPTLVDGVTCPTPLYEPDATYESGDDPRQPAVTMTPYAARQYTKWLSAITGQSFRLPSEAEWEYAARAGSETAYYFGDDPEALGDYAWFADNSDDRSQLVGEKKPNTWGLYDMLGNVGELTLNQYDAGAYGLLPLDRPVSVEEIIRWPTVQDPRVVRGGSWLDEANALRSAARFPTDDTEWKMSDPNLPLSPWWYTELYPAGGVGFRVLRTLEPMSDEVRKRAWEIDAEVIATDVNARLHEGRGALETVSSDLPRVLKQLQGRKVQELLE